jgi:hypothetical protein
LRFCDGTFYVKVVELIQVAAHQMVAGMILLLTCHDITGRIRAIGVQYRMQ